VLVCNWKLPGFTSLFPSLRPNGRKAWRGLRVEAVSGIKHCRTKRYSVSFARHVWIQWQRSLDDWETCLVAVNGRWFMEFIRPFSFLTSVHRPVVFVYGLPPIAFVFIWNTSRKAAGVHWFSRQRLDQETGGTGSHGTSSRLLDPDLTDLTWPSWQTALVRLMSCSPQLNLSLYSENNCATTRRSSLLSQPSQASPYNYATCSVNDPLLFLVGTLWASSAVSSASDILLLHGVELPHLWPSWHFYWLRERIHTLNHKLPSLIQSTQTVSEMNAP